MKHKITHGSGCLLAIAVAAGAYGADATDQRLNELTDLVADLQAEIETLRAQDGTWLDEARAEEVRSLVEDVLADADTRTAMLNGMMAGYDGGFVIGSDDGSFKLKINGQTQVRYVYNTQDNSSDDNRAGFEIRRMKLKFKGHVANDWKYGITGAFDRGGGEFKLEDAFIAYDLDNGMTVKMGQFKGPFMREELISSSKQLLVDRSLVNEEFNQDFTQGIQLSGEASDNMRWAMMYNDGFGADNTPALDEDTEFAFTARAELLGAGDWKQFSDFTSKMGSDYGMMIGAAVHYELEEYGTSTNDDELETISLTGDVSLEFDGANIFAAVVWESTDDDALVDADRIGVVVQGGVYFSEDLEGFARYEYGDPDSDTVEDLNAITVGVNKYFNGHAAKWTTDIGFGIDEVDSTWSSSGAGWRADSADEDGQIVLRSQFQLLF